MAVCIYWCRGWGFTPISKKNEKGPEERSNWKDWDFWNWDFAERNKLANGVRGEVSPVAKS
jgi:hypothetical protein